MLNSYLLKFEKSKEQIKNKQQGSIKVKFNKSYFTEKEYKRQNNILQAVKAHQKWI